MKKLFVLFFSLLTIVSCSANEKDESQLAPAENGTYFNGKKVLVAYFSWGGTTRRMAEAIQSVTGGDIFEIEPVVPYPTSYTPCTEVALEERDTDARPAIKDRVANWDEYDIIFIGCPVWWHTAPMIISTFTESYNFSGKTVVPFCTYASTYRDETLRKIVDLTPDAKHLEGLGTTGSTNGVEEWVKRISHEYDITSGVTESISDSKIAAAEFYDLQGRRSSGENAKNGIYVVVDGGKTSKVFIR